ncbi:MAG: hypothetical protein ACI9TH_004446 [Kiritimatiellia bacterium]|jgi:hypothetical protein
MADVMFNCMFCNESLIVDEQGIGLEAPCPYCLHKMEIPGSAQRVKDPASIIELEAPVPASESATESSALEALSEGVSHEPEGELPAEILDHLSSDNAETVLALLGSLFENEGKGEDAPGREITPFKKPPFVAADKKVISAIEELKRRIDDLQSAYHDADEKVDLLSNENADLRSRIQHEEHEREGLAVKLAHYTQKIEVDAILKDLEANSVGGMQPETTINMAPPTRSKRSYKLLAAMLCLLSVVLLIALYNVTVNDETPMSNAQNAQDLQVKHILLGDAENVNGVRLIAYEAQIASAASVGLDPNRLEGADHCLVIRVTLQNTLKDKNVYLAELWEESGLLDDLGNRLKRISYRINQNEDQDASLKLVLKPNDTVDTTIIFEPPVASARGFVMTCRPGFWLEVSDGYEPITENQFSLKFNRTEIAVAANR